MRAGRGYQLGADGRGHEPAPEAAGHCGGWYARRAPPRKLRTRLPNLLFVGSALNGVVIARRPLTRCLLPRPYFRPRAAAVIEQQGSALQQQMEALGKATQEQVARLQAQVEQVGTGSEEIAARVLKALRETEIALLRQMEEDRDGKKKKRGSLGPSAAPPAAAAAPSITSPRREE